MCDYCFKKGMIQNEKIQTYEDDDILEYKRMAQLIISSDTNTFSVTPFMLARKLGEIGRYSPDSAQILCHFLHADIDTWNTLIDFHRKLAFLSNDNMEDLCFNEKQSYILLLNWLWNLPSLKATYKNI